MKTPKDQGLFFTLFFTIALSFILIAWLLLPAHVKIGEEDEGAGTEEAKPKPVFRGEKAILEADAELTKADEILSRLEKEQADKQEKEKKGQEKGPDKDKNPKVLKEDKTPKKSDAKTSTTKK
ncbi:MAG TPA: hypothetical protein VMN77_08855 [Nitrospiria bacterium]|jgi:hypothetical protein|nr:hypothetical protein [Nitrospiria bacterium]